MSQRHTADEHSFGTLLLRSLCCLVPLVFCLLLPLASTAEAQRAWSVPADLTPGGQHARAPRLAVDATGRAIVTWIREQGSSRVTQSARLTGGSGIWSLPENRSQPSSEFALESTDVALDAAGRGVAVWVRHEGDSDPPVARIQASLYDGRSDTWRAPVDLTDPLATVRHPRAAVDASGNLLVIWVATGPTTRVVQAVRYDAGEGEWGSIATLSMDGGEIEGEPALAIDDGGNAIAVWARSNGTHTIVQAAGYDAESNEWAAPIDVSDAGQSAADPHVSMPRNGMAAVAVWRRSDGFSQIIQVSRLDTEEGTWAAPAAFSDAGADAFESDVAMDESGNVIAAWTRFDGNFRSLQTRRYSQASATWGSITNRTSGGEVLSPNLGVGAMGKAALVWTRRAGNRDIVQATFFDPLFGTWSPAADLSPPLASARLPRVRLHPDGDAVAVWELNASYQIIQASVFAVSTAPVLQPAIVNGPFVTLSWTPPTSGAPPSAYTLVASGSPGGPIIATLPMGLLLSATVLAPDGVYYVRVLVTVDGGQVASNEITVVVGFGPPPSEPLNLRASASGSAVTLTWTPPVNAAIAPVQTSVIEAGSGPGMADLAWFATGSVLTVYEATGVPNGHYYLRVRAQSAGGLSPPSEEARLVVGPMPPGAPTLTGSSGPGGTVTQSWTEAPAPEAPVTGYQLRAGTTTGASNAAILTLPASARTFAASGVPPGTYYVRVHALSAQGLGDPSNEVPITIP